MKKVIKKRNFTVFLGGLLSSIAYKVRLFEARRNNRKNKILMTITSAHRRGKEMAIRILFYTNSIKIYMKMKKIYINTKKKKECVKCILFFFYFFCICVRSCLITPSNLLRPSSACSIVFFVVPRILLINFLFGLSSLSFSPSE
jgi:hypothetical protein